MHSILMPHGLRSGADLIACATVREQEKFLEDIGEGGLCALPFLFEFWAMPHQLPPEGDWRAWVVLGGRGAGKTRAGAEWVRSKVEGARPFDNGACSRVALVGETQDQVREVMIFGDSGIMACSPPDRRPKWIATRNRLEWPNGAVARGQRLLMELELWEVSLVTFPMLPNAGVAGKAGDLVPEETAALRGIAAAIDGARTRLMRT
ncbi:ATP-binding protein [Pseudosulfitobacter pseudonitzschiae]|uniref:ATP-binding protein n=1 Tax=Pseudosulfitobacter pseudonitzschiae TaxID=1402135 RepID=A0A221JYV2_9RHOB|nr:ATP-binding protein [Pseudosulfitobacter pseudonitzschiae]